jgi:hypothetical protein
MLRKLILVGMLTLVAQGSTLQVNNPHEKCHSMSGPSWALSAHYPLAGVLSACYLLAGMHWHRD